MYKCQNLIMGMCYPLTQQGLLTILIQTETEKAMKTSPSITAAEAQEIYL